MKVTDAEGRGAFFEHYVPPHFHLWAPIYYYRGLASEFPLCPERHVSTANLGTKIPILFNQFKSKEVDIINSGRVVMSIKKIWSDKACLGVLLSLSSTKHKAKDGRNASTW